jgi:hypothetical protein
MIRMVLILPIAAALLMAAPAQTTKSKSAPAAKPAVGLTIPKDAVEVEPGLWSAKDAKGKVWHYRRTPFGVRKFEPETRPDTTAEQAEFVTAFDEGGEVIRFERKTPFGKATWRRRKSELDAVELLAWKRAGANRTPAGAANAGATKGARE